MLLTSTAIPPWLLPLCLQPFIPVVSGSQVQRCQSCPCSHQKIILPFWYSYCVFLTKSSISSIFSAIDLTYPMTMKGGNALNFLLSLRPLHFGFKKLSQLLPHVHNFPVGIVPDHNRCENHSSSTVSKSVWNKWWTHQYEQCRMKCCTQHA